MLLKAFKLIVITMLFAIILPMLWPHPVRGEIPQIKDELTFDLKAGWNLISFPFTPQLISGESMKAADLGSLINEQGGTCDLIISYTSGWTPIYDPQLHPVNNFILEEGCGYAVRCQAESSLSVSGFLCKSKVYQFSKDRFYFIGPLGYKPYTAQGLSNEIGTVREIIKNRQTIFDPLIPVSDFELERGQAYFIRCSSDTTWWYVESTGQPFYEDQGVYIWQAPDAVWHIHIHDPENNLTIPPDAINQGTMTFDLTEAKEEDGYDFSLPDPRIHFDFGNLDPDLIRVGLWGMSPESSSFELYSASLQGEVPENTISVEVSETDLKVNDSFLAALYLSRATNVYGLSFHVRFDPEILEAIETIDGGFFPSSESVFASRIWNDIGDVVIGLTQKGSKPGVSREGVYLLATIEFKAKKEGSSLLGFEKNGVYNHEAAAQVSSWFGSRIAVKPQDLSLTTLSILDPPEYCILHYPSFGVTGYLDQYLLGLSPSIKLNGLGIPYNSAGSNRYDFSYDFNPTNWGLSPSLKVITVREENTGANDSVQVYYLPIGQKFAVTSHYEGQIVNTSPLALEGTTDDLDAGIKVICQGNETTASLYPDGRFKADQVSLQEGKNEITVIKTGLAADSSESLSLNLYLDRTPPAISIESPKNQEEIIFDTEADFLKALSPVQENHPHTVITANGSVTLSGEASSTWKRYEGAIGNLTITAIGVNPNNGEIWLGTQNKGIYAIQGQSITSYPLTAPSSPGGALVTINDILIDYDDHAWFATNTGLLLFDHYYWYFYTTAGTFRWNDTSKVWEKQEWKVSGITNNTIRCLSLQRIYGQSNYLMGTDSGLIIFDGYSQWQSYSAEEITGKDGQVSINIRDLAVDKENKLWVAASGYGLFTWDGLDLWEDRSQVDNFTNVKNRRLNSLAFDSQGNLWMGTESNEGIFCFTGNSFISYPGPTYINKLAADQKGMVLAATSSGIYYYDSKINSWLIYTINIQGNDYSSLNYKSVCLDKEGHWLFGPTGLGLFDEYYAYEDGQNHTAYLDLACPLAGRVCQSVDWEVSDQESVELYLTFLSEAQINQENPFTENDRYYPSNGSGFDLAERSRGKDWVRIRVYLKTRDDQFTPSFDYLSFGTENRVLIGQDGAPSGKITLAGKAEDSSPLKGITVYNRNNSSQAIAAVYPGQRDPDSGRITYPFTATGISLTEGENTIAVEAEDAAGNKNLKEIQVVYNSQAVSVSLSSPAPYSHLAPGSQVRVLGKVTGTDVSAYINGQQVEVVDGGFDTLIPLSPDEREIKAVAIDQAHNRAEQTVPVSVFQITSPVADLITNQATIQVQGMLDTDYTVVSMAVSGTAGTPNLSAFTIKPSVLANGQFVAMVALDQEINFIHVQEETPRGTYYTYVCVRVDAMPPTILIDRSQFSDFIENWEVQSQLKDLKINTMAVDTDQERIWIGTRGAGLWVYGTDGLVGIYTTENSQLPSNFINKICIQGNWVWIGTEYGGLARYDQESKEWAVYNRQNNSLWVNTVTSMAPDLEGNLWVGTLGGGVSFYNAVYQTWDRDTYRNTYQQESGSSIMAEGPLSSNNIYCIFIDNENNKWFGSNWGIVNKLSADNQTWTYYKVNPAAAYNAYVTSINMDQEGNQWFTTCGGGLSKLDSQGKLFIYSMTSLVNLSQDILSDPPKVDGETYITYSDIPYSDSEGESNGKAYDGGYILSFNNLGGIAATGYEDTQDSNRWKCLNLLDMPGDGEGYYKIRSGRAISCLTSDEDNASRETSDLVIPNPHLNFISTPVTNLCAGFNSVLIKGLFIDERWGEKWLLTDLGLTKWDAEEQWINYSQINSILEPDQEVTDFHITESSTLLLATTRGLVIFKKIYHAGILNHFVDLSGIVSDNLTDSSLIKVEVNNLPAMVENGRFEIFGLELQDGINTITAVAQDQWGNRAEDSIILFVGQEEDFFSLTDHSFQVNIDSVDYSNAAVTIHWSIEPSDSVVSLYEYFLEYDEGGEWKIIDSGDTKENSKTYPVTSLKGNGNYRLSVRSQASDYGLISPWAQGYFRIGSGVEIQIEEFQITQNQDNQNTFDLDLDFSKIYDQSVYQQTPAIVPYLNGVNKGTITGDVLSISNLTEGKYTLELKSALSSDSVSREIIIDYQAPEVIFDDDMTYDPLSKSIDLSWTGKDNLTSSDKIMYEYRLDSESEWQTISGTDLKLTQEFLPGLHIFHLKATDEAGKSRIYDLSFTVGQEVKKAPEVRFIQKPAAIINYNSVLFHWTASDQLTPSTEIEYSYRLVKLNKVLTSSNPTGSDDLPRPRLDIGWITMTGSENEWEYSYTWDNVNGLWSPWSSEQGINHDPPDPKLYPATPSSGLHTLYVKRKDSKTETDLESVPYKITIDIPVNGNGQINDLYRLTEDEVIPWSNWNKDLSQTLSGLAEGDYCFYVRARDTEQNESIPSGTQFTIDLTPPAFEISSPDSTQMNTLSPLVGFTVKDEIPLSVNINGDKVEELSFIIYPVTIKVKESFYDHYLPSLADNHFTVAVSDTAGNISSLEYSLDPITILSPAMEEGSVFTYSPITIMGIITIDPVQASIIVKGVFNEIKARIDGSGKFVADGLELQSGLNVIQIELKDESTGNVFTKTLNLMAGSSLARGVILKVKENSHASGTAPLPVTFEAQVIMKAEGTIDYYLYEWDFDGDGRYETSEESAEIKAESTFTYNSLGFYHPRVRVQGLSSTEAINSPRYSDSLTINVHGGLESIQKITTSGSGLTDIAQYKDSSYSYYYVLDSAKKEITKYRVESSLSSDMATGQPIKLSLYCSLSQPGGLVVNSKGALLILDSGKNQIVSLTYQGGTYVSRVILDQSWGLNNPYDIAIDDEDNLYISNPGDNSLCVYAFNGQGYSLAKKLSSFENGYLTDQLKDPKGLTFLDGYLYLVDSGQARVLKFAAEKEEAGQEEWLIFKEMWAGWKEGSGDLDNPLRICADENRNYFYLIDQPQGSTGRIQVYNQKGDYLCTIDAGIGVNLDLPVSLTMVSLNGEKFLYVVNQGSTGYGFIDKLSGNLLLMSDAAYYTMLNHKIAFIRDNSIYAVKGDQFGSDLMHIFTLNSFITEDTGNQPEVLDPAWYPDGSKLIFIIYDPLTIESRICTIGVDGNNLRLLSAFDGKVTDPSFNPDGNMIIFCGEKDGQSDLYALEYQSESNGIIGSIFNLTATGYDQETQPCWAPNGQRVAYTLNRKIYVAEFEKEDNEDGSYTYSLDYPYSITSTTSSSSRCTSPCWSGELLSNNKSRIAYVKDNADIYYLEDETEGRFDNLVPIRVTDNLSTSHPTWDSQATKIAFIYQSKVYMVDLTAPGNQPIQVTQGSMPDSVPSFSLDSIPGFTLEDIYEDLIVGEDGPWIKAAWEDNLGAYYQICYRTLSSGVDDCYDPPAGASAYQRYGTSGETYVVTLKAMNVYGEEILSIARTISLKKVWASFTIIPWNQIIPNPYNNHMIKLDPGNSKTYSQQKVKYIWTIDDVEQPARDTKEPFTYTFKTAGTHRIKLTIKDEYQKEIYHSASTQEVTIEKGLVPVIRYEMENISGGIKVTLYADESTTTDARSNLENNLDENYAIWSYEKENPVGSGIIETVKYNNGQPVGINEPVSITYPVAEQAHTYKVTLIIARKHNPGDQPDTETLTKYINIMEDTLQAIIDYEILPDHEDEQHTWVKFDASRSMGRNINWSQCKWQFDNILTKENAGSMIGVTVLQPFPKTGHNRTYTAALTIYRKNSEEFSVATKTIDLEADTLKAVIDYKVDTEEGVSGKRVVFAGAENSLGSGINWSKSQWTVYREDGSNQAIISTAEGPTCVLRFPAHEFIQDYKIKLTIYRYTAEGIEETATTIKSIKIEGDPLHAVIDYRLLKDEENTLNKNIILLDASQSLGADIDWSKCTWEIDGQLLASRGTTVSYDFGYAAATLTHQVSLMIQRFGATEPGDYDTTTRYITLAADELRAVIDYNSDYMIDDNMTIEGSRMVFCSAENSLGSGIDWSKCQWQAYGVQGDNPGPMDSATGPTAVLRFPAHQTDQYYVLKLTIFRINAEGQEETNTTTKYIRIKGEILKAVIDYTLLKEAETGSGITRNIVHFKASNSQGADIDWNTCEWSIDGQKKGSGPFLSYDFGYTGTAVTHEVTLQIQRIGASSAEDFDQTTRTITLSADEFEAVIEFDPNYTIDGMSVVEGKRVVFCSAENSRGFNIDWSRCQWAAYKVEGSNQGLVDSGQGATAVLGFPADEFDQGYIIKLTIYRINADGAEETATAAKSLHIQGDVLAAAINYKLLREEVEGIKKNIVLFDAYNSLGDDIDWSKCEWHIDGKSISERGPSLSYDFGYTGSGVTHEVTLRIQRLGATESADYDQTTRTITLPADEFEAVIEFDPNCLVGTDGEITVTSRVVSVSAANSKGNTIDWSRCQWSAYRVEGSNQGVVDNGQGQTAELSFPANEFDQSYVIKLTIYRINADGAEETATAISTVRIVGDLLKAIINYKLLKEEEQGVEKNIILLDAYNSQGSDIDWSRCEWYIDGAPYKSGSSISYAFDYAAKDIKHEVMLVIYRTGHDQESDTAVKYIEVAADKLEAVISYEINEFETEADGTVRINSVVLDAKDSSGSNINWDKCAWYFDNGEVLQGPTVMYKYQAQDQAYKHPVMLIIYRETKDGEESDSCLQYIRIDEDPLIPIIRIVEAREDQDEEIADKRTMVFSAGDSMGSGIIWEKCEWSFGVESNKVDYGPTASHSYYLMGEDHWYPVTLTICRKDIDGNLVYSEPKKEYFKIEGDKLEADFTWEYLGNGKVQFDATSSKGMFIDWSVCRWSFGEDSDEIAANWQNSHSNTEGTSSSTGGGSNFGISIAGWGFNYGDSDAGDATSNSETWANGEGGQTSYANQGLGPVVLHQYNYYELGLYYPVTLTIYRRDMVTGTYTESSSITKWVRPESLKITQPINGTNVNPGKIATGQSISEIKDNTIMLDSIIADEYQQLIYEIEVKGRIDMENVDVFVNEVKAEVNGNEFSARIDFKTELKKFFNFLLMGNVGFGVDLSSLHFALLKKLDNEEKIIQVKAIGREYNNFLGEDKIKIKLLPVEVNFKKLP